MCDYNWCIQQVKVVCSANDNIGNLRNHVSVNPVKIAVFQDIISLLSRKIVDDNAIVSVDFRSMKSVSADIALET